MVRIHHVSFLLQGAEPPEEVEEECDAADVGQGRQSQGKKVSIPIAGTAMVLHDLNGYALFTQIL